MPDSASQIDDGIAAQRRQVVDAAIGHIAESGVDGMTMQIVAVRARMARRTVYRLFSSKLELLEAVAVARLDVLTERVRRGLSRCTSLREALVQGSVEIVKQGRSDSVFMAAMQTTVQGELMLYFVDPASPVHGHSHALWDEVLARGRASGELNPTLPEESLHNWLRSVHLMLFMRRDLDRRGQIELLEHYVLPALLAGPDRAAQ
jgi:AcrR family transcriptional regulator